MTATTVTERYGATATQTKKKVVGKKAADNLSTSAAYKAAKKGK